MHSLSDNPRLAEPLENKEEQSLVYLLRLCRVRR